MRAKRLLLLLSFTGLFFSSCTRTPREYPGFSFIPTGKSQHFNYIDKQSIKRDDSAVTFNLLREASDGSYTIQTASSDCEQSVSIGSGTSYTADGRFSSKAASPQEESLSSTSDLALVGKWACTEAGYARPVTFTHSAPLQPYRPSSISLFNMTDKPEVKPTRVMPVTGSIVFTADPNTQRLGFRYPDGSEFSLAGTHYIENEKQPVFITDNNLGTIELKCRELDDLMKGLEAPAPLRVRTFQLDTARLHDINGDGAPELRIEYGTGCGGSIEDTEDILFSLRQAGPVVIYTGRGQYEQDANKTILSIKEWEEIGFYECGTVAARYSRSCEFLIPIRLIPNQNGIYEVGPIASIKAMPGAFEDMKKEYQASTVDEDLPEQNGRIISLFLTAYIMNRREEAFGFLHSLDVSSLTCTDSDDAICHPLSTLEKALREQKINIIQDQQWKALRQQFPYL